jgi:ADP-ribosylglycohydrolase
MRSVFHGRRPDAKGKITAVMARPSDHERRLLHARVALEGLSVGDAFGERFFVSPETVEGLIEQRALPAAPWRWTDDTAMALGVLEMLEDHGGIDRDALAVVFARRYWEEPDRGYGGGAHRILQALNHGESWTVAAASVFRGEGSMGNGAAMRVAPVGAYFADDLDAVVEHAAASADPTHAHPDGRAGAVAVAVAAAVACRDGGRTDPGVLFEQVISRTPEGPTRDGLAVAQRLGVGVDHRTAAAALGNGARVIASDTVPFSVWAAARHLHDFEEAMWTTVAALGDRDTTCAIVGGIVAAAGAAIPPHFISAREPLRI